MRMAYKARPLGDVCSIIGGGTPSKANKKFYDGEIPWATVRDMKVEILSKTEFQISDDAVANSSTNIIPRNNVVIATRVGLGKVCLLTQNTAINQDLRGIVPNHPDKLVIKYLFRWLQSVAHLIEQEGTGLTVKGIKLPFLKSLQIPLPPLAEQKRIVAILDEAFERIGAAVANAEKNLANARELFESYLNAVFTQKGEGWADKKLGEIAVFRNGLSFTKNSRGETVQIVGVKDFQNNYYVPVDELNSVRIDGELRAGDVLKDGDILTVRSNGNKELIGRCILARDITQKTSHSGFTIRIRLQSDDAYPNFLVHFLKSQECHRKLIESGSGINISSLNQQALSALSLRFPSIAEQKKFVSQMEELTEETQRLEVIYRQKLDNLSEMKQSFLQKAFTGELTSELKVAQPAKGTKSVEVKTTSPEFTAKVLAFVHHRHVAKRRDRTFGRVKAQKTLHLVESIGGVDLGRVPIKDAAGPNDFQHMIRAESWAIDNQLFEFVKRPNGYDFKKLGRYKELIAGVFTTIEPYRKELDKIIDLVAPMNSRQSELFVTVHAAWNNLIRDGVEIDDEAIIREARENWHPDKMKIPELKFREAVRKIRDKGLVPDGKAKRVGGQESLF